MLRYAGAPPRVVKGVQYFRCGICERDSEEKKPFPMKTPSPYTFNETIGLDVFEVKDAAGTRFQILHAICHGTTFQCGEVLGEAQGVPSSARCMQAFLRFWSCWAGTPQYILADRGLHNRGVFQSELEKAGVKFRTVATEAPWELGRAERHGRILKHMMNKIVMAEQVTGKDEMRMALAEALNTKNRLGNLAGFSPQQWVLGHHPKMEGWPDEEISETYVLDEDAMSAFNRRAAFREASRLSWMQEDSQKRIRKGILRQGGSEHGIYRTGDMVSFQRKRGGKPRWFGPARVLVQEGRNLWILHGGVPIVIAETMVGPSCPEELLEHELLGKRTKGVKTRGSVVLDTKMSLNHTNLVQRSSRIWTFDEMMLRRISWRSFVRRQQHLLKWVEMMSHQRGVGRLRLSCYRRRSRYRWVLHLRLPLVKKEMTQLEERARL